MKNLSKVVFVLAVLVSATAQAQIDNLSNMSPEWIRTGTRNTTTDGTDAVVYNPAGVTHLKKGFHVSIGNQMFFRKPSHSYDLGYGEQKFEQDGNDPFVPNLYVAYNKNNWAAWGGFYISGGGATANYPKGTFNTDLISMMLLQNFQGAYTASKDQYLKSSSAYMTGTAGISIKANDQLSFAAGVRYVSAKNTTKAGTTLTASPYDMPDAVVELKSEDNAKGMAAIFGVYAKPTEKFSIAMRLETKTKLNFETKQINDNLETISEGQAELVTDGAKNRRDLPGMFGLALGYEFSKTFKASAEMNYYFQSNADWGRYSDEKTVSALAGDAINYAVGFEWKACKWLTWSAGGVYTDLRFTDRDAYYTTMGAFETAPNDNITLNTGFAIDLSDKFRINLGVAKSIYKKDEQVKALALYPMDVNVKVNNDVLMLGAGLDVRF